MSMDKLWETKKRLEQINRTVIAGTVDPLHHKGPKFEERHKRITLYLENEVYSDLQAIRSQGISQSLVVNLALKEFFGKNWPDAELP